jgi:hypothetical protein
MGEWKCDPINFYILLVPTIQNTEFPTACSSVGLSLLAISHFFVLTGKPAQKQKLYSDRDNSQETEPTAEPLVFPTFTLWWVNYVGKNMDLQKGKMQCWNTTNTVGLHIFVPYTVEHRM